ncbi:hypothetical protein MD484_g5295, partial [Candolleomyces efflorescens]
MSVAVLAPPQPIIPVIDERLNFPVDASKDHKDKIHSYNDMLEDIFQRELELAKLKASLVDMKVEIVEEGQTLDPKGRVILPSSLKTDSESSDAAASSSSEGDSEALETDSASGEDVASKLAKPKNRKRRGSKGKSKGKGRDATRKEELGKDWDYNLSMAGGARRAERVDAEDDE